MRLSMPRLRAPSVACLAALVALAACDGQNQFASPITPGQGGSGGTDTRAPSVTIQIPRGDSLSAKPLGDSLLVRAEVSDNTGVDSVAFFGFSERGNPDLGTDTVIQRFETKQVILPSVRDTVINRYLIPTADSVKETAKIVVVAWDSDGNAAADTVSLILGGPDVTILDVEAGQSVQATKPFGFRVVASDPNGIIQVRTQFSGAFDTVVVANISPPLESDTVRFEVLVPADAAGEVQMTATARNSLDVAGQYGPLTLNVVGGVAADTSAPRVRAVATATDRLELKDSLAVALTAQDDPQGSGIARVGVTVLGISPARRDTVEQSQERTYAPSRTGTVSETFKFSVFNVDSLDLPDTLTYQVYGYAVDDEGNCAASVGADTLTALPCADLPGGGVAAQGRVGQQLTRTVVAGRTVRLPSGGMIMDAVVDTLRRNLYLSNYDQNRVEVFRLQDERFLPAVGVGSQPWGLALNRTQDTLLVANSGGTNISSVALGAADGLGPFAEDYPRRLLTPDVVLFDVERAQDDLGYLRYNVTVTPDAVPPGFSDRPQFLAVDSTGRRLYSTKVTELGDYGTIRKAFVPAGADPTDPDLRPEVKLFYEHAALDKNPNYVAVGNIDGAAAVPEDGNDKVLLVDHVPGYPDQIITAGPDSLAAALAELASKGSDVVAGSGRWNVPNLGFSDTTYVSASGDGGWVVFGEGSVDPVGRIIMYNAEMDAVTDAIPVTDLMTNASETVRGVGLNYDGTLGVARGNQAYFFTTDLRLQGVVDVPPGGAGAVLHPLHANAKSLDNYAGQYQPDTHLAFLGTGEHTIDIVDTSHFLRLGRIFIRDVVNGPLRASLPFPEDQPAGATCLTTPVTDRAGNYIGDAIQIYRNGDFNDPYGPSGDGTDDACIVVKLYGVTDSGGVVVVDVRKADVLRYHPARQ